MRTRFALTVAALLAASAASAQSVDPARLPGIVLDNVKAELIGDWKDSQHTRPFVGDGYIHDDNKAKGERSVVFTATIDKAGSYHVLLAYTPGKRARNVPVTIETADGAKTVEVDQSKKPAGPYNFQPLGEFQFAAGQEAKITVSNKGTNSHVIVDALQILTADELKLAQEFARKNPVVAAKNNNKNTKPKKEEVAARPVPFKPIPPTEQPERVTPQQIDELLMTEVDGMADIELVADEVFLRRASLDIVGRQPTVEELEQFMSDTSDDKRAAAVDRLLKSADYGANWATYWADVVGYRQQEPELTFHDYGPFKQWLAGELNEGTTWDEVVFRLITARGRVKQAPEATFIGFHQGNANRIAGETSRVFLGVQIACAECHDHPFVDMPTEVFHGMAAFFARTEAKIPQLDSGGIEVKSRDKGEHKIEHKKKQIPPIALDGTEFDLGMADVDRRVELANWIIAGNNKQFARAYVNRVWDRLIGRGFYEAIDDMGEDADPVLPDVLAAVSDHFVATGFDTKDLVRLITATRAYQRRLDTQIEDSQMFASKAKKLRGDEIFASLQNAIELPNVVPPRAKKTSDIRFPPPPKSTRDLVNDAFGYDPSFGEDRIVRTMKQAMFMMNNTQLQAQVDASPESETYLARLLASEADNAKAVDQLYMAVLARRPTDKEKGITLSHIKKVGERGAAFEDILWSLINSAEFTTRR